MQYNSTVLVNLINSLLMIVRLLFLFLPISALCQYELLEQSASESGFRNNLPVCDSCPVPIHHTYFSLSYAEFAEQAYWIAYVLDSSDFSGEEERASRFIPDPLISTGSANDKDYAKSGFDRGHLVPAQDMSFDPIAMKESFYYSNMSPQVPGFNRGVWKRLEAEVRKMALSHGSLLIITGPVLKAGLPRIGPNDVAVPEAYFKIVVDGKSSQAIAFLIPNQTSPASLTEFALSIDAVESLTGIDFLPHLQKSVAEQLESTILTDYWFH